MKLLPEEIFKIKQLFENVVGSELEVKVNNNDNNEKKLFLTLIEYLDDSLSIEETILELGQIDLSRITSPLWDVIITLMEVTYGAEVVDVTKWFLFERYLIFEDDTVSTEYVDFDENVVSIENLEDLWLYVKGFIY